MLNIGHLSHTYQVPDRCPIGARYSIFRPVKIQKAEEKQVKEKQAEKKQAEEKQVEKKQAEEKQVKENQAEEKEYDLQRFTGRNMEYRVPIRHLSGTW
ncbi:hypothetical protein Glove_152g121 [Diversispora epigaea]|uniref:Uncharacterized protein n=1 Tax=Diversispora epigaea TaxID=1348612 RepID=A0A397IVJ9_9GLOM|nr:hypothetical protein Glove_152g121 [Diversispora epigaea]